MEKGPTKGTEAGADGEAKASRTGSGPSLADLRAKTKGGRKRPLPRSTKAPPRAEEVVELEELDEFLEELDEVSVEEEEEKDIAAPDSAAPGSTGSSGSHAALPPLPGLPGSGRGAGLAASLGLPTLNVPKKATPPADVPPEEDLASGASVEEGDATDSGADADDDGHAAGTATSAAAGEDAATNGEVEVEDEGSDLRASGSSSRRVRGLPGPGDVAARAGTRAADVSVTSGVITTDESSSFDAAGDGTTDGATDAARDVAPSEDAGALVDALAREISSPAPAAQPTADTMTPAEGAGAMPSWLPRAGLGAGALLVVVLAWRGCGGDGASQPPTQPPASVAAMEDGGSPEPVQAEVLAATTGAGTDDGTGETGATGTTAGEGTTGTTGTTGTAGTTGGGTTSGGDETTGGEDRAEPVASSGSRRTTRRKRRSSTTSKTEPEPAPPPSISTASSGPSLADAQAALRAKKYKEAYRLASKVKSGGSDATYVLAVAACGMSDVTKATAAWRRLPLIKRGKAKRACKKLGVSL